jgi:hypothetical protein
VDVPVIGVATASTGIRNPPAWRYFEYFVISKEKPIKPAVTVGLREKWKRFPNCSSPVSSNPESFLKAVPVVPEGAAKPGEIPSS